MIILKEKNNNRRQEGITNYDKAVIQETKRHVEDILHGQHDNSKKTAGAMWPGEDKYWIDQAIGAIDALCMRANEALVTNTHSIDQYYNAFQNLRKQLVTFNPY